MKEEHKEKYIVKGGEWWKCHELLNVPTMRMKPGYAPISTAQVSGLVGLLTEIHKRLGDGPLRMVELGSWSGDSAAIWAGSRLFKPLWLIDQWPQPAHEGVCEYNMRRFGKDVVMIQGDMFEIGEDWKEPVDVIYLDADHSLEATRKVLPIWYKHLKPGGIMSGHDYNENAWPGVVQGVNEFFPDQTVKTFEDTSWMIQKPLE